MKRYKNIVSWITSTVTLKIPAKFSDGIAAVKVYQCTLLGILPLCKMRERSDLLKKKKN